MYSATLVHTQLATTHKPSSKYAFDVDFGVPHAN